MHTIIVRRTVAASPEAMYDLLIDPVTYRQFPGVSLAELVRPGVHEQLGVGAVRRIHISVFRYDEEILAADRGREFSYRVVASRPRLEHELGTVRFEPVADGCEVTWTTRYRVPVPVFGPVMARLGGLRMRRAFEDSIRLSAQLAPLDG
jgi:uncharacterized protein YndB with AHSA1/START domain